MRVKDPELGYLFNLLPDELVQLIFKLSLSYQPLLTVFTHPGLHDAFSIDPNASHPFQLKLTSVCRKWRRIALSCPRLWCVFSLCVKATSHDPERAEYAKMWLERTGNLPLYIRITHLQYFQTSSGQLEAIIPILNEYASRWRVLDLQIPADALSQLRLPSTGKSILRSFSYRQESLPIEKRLHKLQVKFAADVNIRPHLRHLSISHMPLANFRFNYQYLKEFTGAHLPLLDCLKLMHLAPKLVVANLHPDLSSRVPASATSVPEHLQNVVHFSLRELFFRHYPRLGFWSRSTLPFLNRLTLNMSKIRRDEGAVYVDITEFVKRSDCPITYLEIIDLQDDEQLLDFLAELPLVETLVITISPSYRSASVIYFLQQLARKRQPQPQMQTRTTLLPNLQHFSIAGMAKVSELDDLLNLMRSPELEGVSDSNITTDPPLRPLVNLKLSIQLSDSRPLPNHFKERQYNTLLMLIEQGAHVALYSGITKSSSSNRDILKTPWYRYTSLTGSILKAEF